MSAQLEIACFDLESAIIADAAGATFAGAENENRFSVGTSPCRSPIEKSRLAPRKMATSYVHSKFTLIWVVPGGMFSKVFISTENGPEPSIG